MIDLHYWTTPNGHKITMFLEETGLPYNIVPVNLPKNDQFKAEFLEIAPNNKMPAIVDHSPLDGGVPISLFESGAILLYLAEKTALLMPEDIRGRAETMQWLFWQVAGLGPMPGQLIFFLHNTEKFPFAIERYRNETARLFSVLNKRLEGREWLAGNTYSIADIAAYSWAAPYSLFGLDVGDGACLRHCQRYESASASTGAAGATSGGKASGLARRIPQKRCRNPTSHWSFSKWEKYW
jgi:GST-like protein